MSDHLPLATAPTTLVETHSAILFFVGDRVYKMKKPVDLGFLDFSTRQARLAACHEEVRLNARLAPAAYLGVADVAAPDGSPCEHLVVMRRMPEDRRLSACVARGDDVDDELRAIARAVAALHDVSAPDSRHDRLAEVGSVRARWIAGFEQIRGIEDVAHDRARDRRTQDLVTRYLDGRAGLFEHRIRRGRVRDGHGDLLAEDIFLLPEGPQILDCLEFCEDYRWSDVLADVAFLAMDLERIGRGDLGHRFLELHREFSADSWPASLAHHYVAYRAHVRAKVGLLRAAQTGTPLDPDTDALFDLALRHLEAGRVRLVVVGGAPGTGKSTVASALGDRLGAVVLRTDEIRNRAGQAHGYAPEDVADTYRQMFADAGRLLALGEHVVLDATFGDAAQRAEVRSLAERSVSDLTELVCELPVEVARRRVADRMLSGTDPSEATPAVAQLLADRFARWPEATVLDTRRPPEQVAADALDAVG